MDPPSSSPHPPSCRPPFLFLSKGECRFSNGTGRGGSSCRCASSSGTSMAGRSSCASTATAESPLGKPDAELWNSQKEALEYRRAQVDFFCRRNYEIDGTFAHAQRVQPTVSISPTKEDPLSPHTLLLCTAASFYPLEIEIKWLKNGQEEKEGVLYGEELRNGDWTYQTQVMLETTPEHGDVYTCRVEHVSLETPITVQWEPRRSDSARSKVWTGAGGAVLGVVFVAVGLSLYLKSKKAPPIQPPTALIS